MGEQVLITGGAGFIGSHLADSLIAEGHDVTILDILHPQVHGNKQAVPTYLNPNVVFIQADVRDRDMLKSALAHKTAVYHLAAYTGVGQSMYHISEYLDVNVQGTAVLMELLSQQTPKLNRFVLASSRAVYGEGAYHCSNCGVVHPKSRSLDQLRQSQWDVSCPNCGKVVTAIPTSENTVPDPHSIYAISKHNQEQICLLLGETYDIPVVVLRYFNVYGPRQSLSNPYTGVISTFVTRLMNGYGLQVYEDGTESRDFVHVKDIVQACLLALKKEEAVGQVINIGSGEILTLLEIAQIVTQKFNGPEPVITGQYRAGDIRHCYADLTQARNLLGYKPKIVFKEGVEDLIEGLGKQILVDYSAIAEAELIKHGLAARA
jgi:dTDP-L-rhamnose 4-epimerase